MTRPFPTQDELSAGEALKVHLVNEGHSVTSLVYGDAPDIRWNIDGTDEACECVQIPPNRLLKYVHTRFRHLTNEGSQAKAVRVIWPKEAHAWILEVIAEKQAKYKKYCANAGVDRIDLLIHASDSGSDMIRITDPKVVNQIRWAGSKAKCSFRSIYFYSPKTGVERIYPPEHHAYEPQFDTKLGYPTSSFTMSTLGPITTTRTGDPPYTLDMGVVVPEIIIVPPTTAAYRKCQPFFRPHVFHWSATVYDTRIDMHFRDVGADEPGTHVSPARVGLQRD